MPSRALNYIAHHAIAITALVCSILALAASSYAAFSLPAGSVGAAQIRNHVITPVKLNSKSIAGSIRAWAVIQWGGSGKLVARASNSRVRVTTGNNGESITWPHQQFSRRCTASATPQLNLNLGMHRAGFVTAQFDPTNHGGAFLQLFGFAVDGTPSPQAVDVVIVCP